jgi:hypothetical protein
MRTWLITCLVGVCMLLSLAFSAEEEQRLVPLPPTGVALKQPKTPAFCLKNGQPEPCKQPKRQKRYKGICKLQGRYRICF